MKVCFSELYFILKFIHYLYVMIIWRLCPILLIFCVFSALKEESHLEQVSPASWHSSKSTHILGDSTNHVIIDVNKIKPSVEETYGVAMKNLADDRKLANRPDSVEVSFHRFYIQGCYLWLKCYWKWLFSTYGDYFRPKAIKKWLFWL